MIIFKIPGASTKSTPHIPQLTGKRIFAHLARFHCYQFLASDSGDNESFVKAVPSILGGRARSASAKSDNYVGGKRIM